MLDNLLYYDFTSILCCLCSCKFYFVSERLLLNVEICGLFGVHDLVLIEFKPILRIML